MSESSKILLCMLLVDVREAMSEMWKRYKAYSVSLLRLMLITRNKYGSALLLVWMLVSMFILVVPIMAYGTILYREYGSGHDDPMLMAYIEIFPLMPVIIVFYFSTFILSDDMHKATIGMSVFGKLGITGLAYRMAGIKDERLDKT